MNKVHLTFLYTFMLGICNLASAQINLKIESVSGNPGTWGIFVRACDDVSPTSSTITGSGQVTIKYPSGLTIYNLTNHAGTWGQNALVSNPSEAVGYTYVSMGFVVDNPQIIYLTDGETLLFTFKLNGSASGAPQLIENGVDPFDQLPNSANSNPGNELTVLDFGAQPLGLYTYVGNYTATMPPACGSEPQDTTVVTPPIDTTDNNDTTVIDTTGSGGDTTVIDTTDNSDTTVIDTTGGGDTTIITPPVDTTEQTSGVRDLEKKRTYFTIYPTPSFYDWVTVKFLHADPEGGTIRLFTLNGVPLGELPKGSKTELRLNLSGLPPGLYLIAYEKAGKVLQRDKFLKQ